ncbi:MAG: preprotein translocase subunit YajC, partial [Bacteroides sp.]
QKGYEVITIGGLYGTVDEVDTDKKTVVLDVDGVYLTFELTAIKTVLPLTEGIPAAAGGVVDSCAGIRGHTGFWWACSPARAGCRYSTLHGGAR